jgi:post-segregation antitoxin (ccd killing protein)
MTIHHVNTTISPADLLEAAQDAGLTIGQFEAKAIADAVEENKRRKRLWREMQDALGIVPVPGGD